MATADNPVVVKAPTADKATSAEERQDKFTENTMREYFASRPKVTIKTREDEWVQVNGYTFIIQAGQRVEVPQDVADILEEAGRI
jgi:hypothetical protein